MLNDLAQALRLLRTGLRHLGMALLALLILFEEWGWVPLQRLMARLGRLPVLRRLEAAVARLPPRAALAVFLLPTLLLLPVKLLALWLIGQGKALNAVASRNVKVLVVGNPANTNAYIAMKSAPDLPRKNFTAMLRLDHNRAASQLAAKTGKPVADIEKLTVWGNHSPTMYADYRFATIKGESVAKMINDQEWNANTFLPTVGKRGAAIIEARGLSSAASAANAAIDHMRDWALGTNGKWVTMGIPSDGQYGIPKDVMFGFPVTCENGEYKTVEGLAIDAFSQERIEKTLKELTDEQAGVAHLL